MGLAKIMATKMSPPHSHLFSFLVLKKPMSIPVSFFKPPKQLSFSCRADKPKPIINIVQAQGPSVSPPEYPGSSPSPKRVPPLPTITPEIPIVVPDKPEIQTPAVPEVNPTVIPPEFPQQPIPSPNTPEIPVPEVPPPQVPPAVPNTPEIPVPEVPPPPAPPSVPPPQPGIGDSPIDPTFI